VTRGGDGAGIVVHRPCFVLDPGPRVGGKGFELELGHWKAVSGVGTRCSAENGNGRRGYVLAAGRHLRCGRGKEEQQKEKVGGDGNVG
jgi:hypothetical protein